MKEGFKGACPTCEPVAELNQELEARIKSKHETPPIVFVYEEKMKEMQEVINKLSGVLKRYSENNFWRKQTQTTFTITNKEDLDFSFSAKIGGKLAREVLNDPLVKKYKEEE